MNSSATRDAVPGLQGRLPGRRLEHPVAQLAQDLAEWARTSSSSSTTRIVSAGHGRARRASRRLDLAVGEQPRQVDLDRRAVADLAVDLHVAAGLLDEAVDLREPEAGAVADVLGGEERLERLRSDLRPMPVPVSVTASMTY